MALCCRRFSSASRHRDHAVQYAANVKAVLDQIKDDTKVIPGHGPLASKADLAGFHQVLTDTIKIVQAARKAKKTLDQAKQAGLPEKYKSWGEGFIKCFHDYHVNLSPEAYKWPLEQFEHYGDDLPILIAANTAVDFSLLDANVSHLGNGFVIVP